VHLELPCQPCFSKTCKLGTIECLRESCSGKCPVSDRDRVLVIVLVLVLVLVLSFLLAAARCKGARKRRPRFSAALRKFLFDCGRFYPPMFRACVVWLIEQIALIKPIELIAAY